MTATTSHLFLCNGAQPPDETTDAGPRPQVLEYSKVASVEPNVSLDLPPFVRQVNHLPARILDLLELAAYVFAADRLTDRGDKDALEYRSWARSMRFAVRVREPEFWARPEIARSLSEALEFMSGDREYKFDFQSGHATPPTGLFDDSEFAFEPTGRHSVVLFSGGIDSLAGVLERLQETGDALCLVSHQSQPGTVRTQRSLVKALQDLFPNRITHYQFKCHLTNIRANEETQRTRAFLYLCIAFAIAVAHSTSKVFVYENGVTAMNFPKRQDMINARASRTVHPHTMGLLDRFFALVGGANFHIERPFQWMTKSEVLSSLVEHGGQDLLSSSVSCSRTFQNLGQATHCGWCSQCVDRRFAAYSSELDDVDDAGIYAHDLARHPITCREAKTLVLDYVAQALSFREWNIDHFHDNLLSELVGVIMDVGLPEEEAVEQVYSLCRRHGEQVRKALRRMQSQYDDPGRQLPENSLLYLVNAREHLKEPVQRIAEAIGTRLTESLPRMFREHQPSNENDLNDKISAIVNDGRSVWEREHPSVRFAVGTVRPDHSSADHDLWIEAKYIRGSTSPGSVAEAMAADFTQYPASCHILYVVYDPNRRIPDDSAFRGEFESRGRCTVCVVR